MKLSLEQLSAVSGGKDPRNYVVFYQNEDKEWVVKIASFSGNRSMFNFFKEHDDAKLFYISVSSLLPVWEKSFTDGEIYGRLLS